MEQTLSAKDPYRRNRFTFGIGTIGRDMVYTIVSMYLIVYLTEVLKISTAMLAAVTIIMVVLRVFDALNDPIMGTIVDNTHTKWGKFKPWMALGAVLSGLLTVLLFTDFGLQGAGFVALFAVIYLMWGVTFTANDISYWSMMPALSNSQKEREKIGAMARIFANIGLFAVVAGIIPITKALGGVFGNDKVGYTVFTIILVVIMWAGQCVTLFGVKEPHLQIKTERTTLRGMIKAIVKNDQLLFTAIAMALFMIGYTTTTSFGVHFFKYAYQNEDMYSIFAVILGVSQILALVLFPLFSKRFSRRQLYTGATIMVVAGYLLFFFSPMNMIPIGIAGVLIFFAQAFIQLLMLVFLTDTVEYGEWKLKKRNESVSFALQPFINKLGGAVASGILGLTLIITGLNEAPDPASVTAASLWTMKIFMLIIPLVFIAAGYILYLFKYKIDKKTYDKILVELEERKQQEKAASEVHVPSADDGHGENADPV